MWYKFALGRSMCTVVQFWAQETGRINHSASRRCDSKCAIRWSTWNCRKDYVTGLESPRFWDKVFRFLGFIGRKITTHEEHPIHHSPCYRYIFFYNYNKTHKSRLKYELEYDLYKIAHKNLKKLKNVKFGLFLKKTKEQGFRSHFRALLYVILWVLLVVFVYLLVYCIALLV